MGGSSGSKPSVTATGWDCIWPDAKGPVDAVQEIQMGRPYRVGRCRPRPLSTGHGLTSLINKPTLFGGDEHEGGVVGTIDVLSGLARTRKRPSDESPRQFHSGISGVLSWWRASILFANNPYIAVAVRVRRFNAGWHDHAPDGECRSPHPG